MKNTIKIFAYFLLLLCSTFAFAQTNPLEGKTYCLDIMGNDALSFDFKANGVVNIKAQESLNMFDGANDFAGSYTFNPNSTVVISVNGDPLVFAYDKTKDTLSADMGDGFSLTLTPKGKTSSAPKNKSLNASNPSSLAGRLYVGTFMNMDFLRISFTDEKNCVLQALTDPTSTNYETETATYLYDKNLGTVIITDSTDSKVTFDYDSSSDTLNADIGQGIIIKCTRRK